MSYCEFSATRPAGDVHQVYHDEHYGTPIHNDNELFGRLILEINQAGLSWELMLKKQDHFRKAFAGFDVQTIADFDESKIETLLQDAGIIRNRLKINSVIYNAKRIVEIQDEFGSFENWLELHRVYNLQEWVKLFKNNFKFVGGEIVNEFLMSTGYLPGAHQENCFRWAELKLES